MMASSMVSDLKDIHLIGHMIIGIFKTGTIRFDGLSEN